MLDPTTLARMPRRLHAVLRTTPEPLVERFITSCRAYNPAGKILPRRLRYHAIFLFPEYGIGQVALDPAYPELGMVNKNDLIVRAILLYMKYRGLVKVHAGHYYWPEHDIARHAKRRYARRDYERLDAEAEAEALPDEGPGGDAGPVINIRAPAPDNRSGR